MKLRRNDTYHFSRKVGDFYTEKLLLKFWRVRIYRANLFSVHYSDINYYWYIIEFQYG